MNEMRKLMEAVTLVESEDDAAIKQIEAVLKRKRSEHKNQLVRMVTGKYSGRIGVCWTLHLQTRGEEVYFSYMIYVLRRDGTDVLNTDGPSRSFWREEDFEWLDETWDGPNR